MFTSLNNKKQESVDRVNGNCKFFGAEKWKE
jgi:hypothetical protein